MSKGKNLKTKTIASVMAASLVVSAFPVTALAVTGDKVAKDAEYVKSSVLVSDGGEEITDYHIDVSFSVADGVFKDVKVTSSDVGDDDSNYLKKAVNGKSKNGVISDPGIVSIEGQPATEDTINAWDGVSTATVSSKAIKAAALELINGAEEAQTTPDPSPTPTPSEDPTTEGYVYGTVNLSYADFYYGELNDVAENAEMDLTAKDKVTEAGYREDGMYDAVTSATANKWKKMFADVTYTEALEKGGQILGLKDVNIAVPTKLYNEAKAAIEAGSTCENKLLDIVGAMTVNEDQTQAPAEYKILNGDGTLTKLASETVTDDAAEATLLTSSGYGNYQVNVTSQYLKGSNSEILGVVFETEKGEKYGMEHLENIWRGGSQVSFAVVDGFLERHGNTVDAKRSKGLEGQTITKLTYMLKDKADVVVNTKLYVPYQIPGGKGVTLDKENISKTSDGLKVPVYIKNPDGGSYVIDSVSYGGKTLTEGTDYQLIDEEWLAYDNLKINNTENTGVGTYTVTFKDEKGKYVGVSDSFVYASDYKDGDVKLENNALVMPEGLAVTAYLNNVSSISVNGNLLRGRNLGTTVFNQDGTVNFDAVIKGRGSETPVFPDKGAEYTIEVQSTGYPTVSGTVKENVVQDEYTYVYAGLTWSEYWASEGVYAAGSTAQSEEVDARGEHDKGAFDTVTRATKNHGLHRGSFQSTATIYDTDGNKYEISHWSEDGSTITLTDGSTVGFSKGTITKADGSTATMDYYDVYGIKYVPVKVKTEDYEAFAAKYNVVQNDGTLAGGYGEGQLKAYTATAQVTEATNGLKTATKNDDGSFSFSARATGTDSGIKDASLKTAAPTVTVKDADGSYGEFLRVDMTGDYGDLGSNMQAVRWDYYGSDSTYQNVLASYGTKFAADNWMHKVNGIQLGLTDSLRCQLPEGTDGTGYWKLTLYALGYNDYTVTFKATEDNIVKPSEDTVDTAALEAAIANAEALKESDYTADSWSSMQTELNEAKEILAAESKTQAMVDEALAHLNAAVEALVKAEINTTALEAAIDKASALESRDYTNESWDAMKATLELAKAELKDPKSQESVDTATANLNAAIEGLEERVELPIFKITNKCPASYTMDLAKKDNAGYAKNKSQVTTTWDDIKGVKLSYQWISTNSSVVKTSLATASGKPKNSMLVTQGLKKGSATCICIVKATLPDGTTATTAHAEVIKINLTSLKVTSNVPSSKTISVKKGTYKIQVNTNWDNIPGVKLTYKWTAKSSSTVKASLSTSSGKPKNSCLNLKGRKKGTTTCTLKVTAKLPGGNTQTVTKTVKVKVVK